MSATSVDQAAVPLRTHLLEGTVRHRRHRPIDYELQHDVWYLALDLDEVDVVDRRSRLLRRNRRGVVSFRDADYWPRPGLDLPGAVRAHLRAEGIDPTDWRITLVSTPRILGYQFNPASFYLCRDDEGVLRVVVVEVHNTHGERHLYTLRPERPTDDGSAFVAGMDKDFYVSPFIDMDGQYRVQVRDDCDRLRIAIIEGQGERRSLTATLVLRRLPFGDRGLLRLLVGRPLVTHKTIVMIHWHALKLWLRGLRFHRHGEVAR